MIVSHYDGSEQPGPFSNHIYPRPCLAVLEPLRCLNSGKRKAEKKAPSSEARVSTGRPINLFDALELEEVEDNSASSFELVTWFGKLDSPGHQSLVSFKIECSDDGILFSIFCLFKDMNDIRTFLY
jgi:hypothetical protein